MFLIRANYNKESGAGHYMRVIRLANEIKLQKKTNKILIVLDKKFNNFFYDYTLKHIFLYQNNKYKNEITDSNKIKKLIKKKKIQYLILDDYRFGIKWTKALNTDNLKIILINDTFTKKNICHYYINFKELSLFENDILKKKITIIDKKLIGPKYAIINSKIRKKNKLSKIKKLLFYAGNSGRAEVFFSIIKTILYEAKKNKKEIYINLFFGKDKYPSKKFTELSKSFNNIKLLINQFDIEKYLNEADLYFGFSGNAIYENSYLKLISLLFPMSSNQVNEHSNMEKLGHFLIFKKSDLKKKKKLSDLVFKLLSKIDKLKKEFFKNNDVSKQGAKKIIKEIFSKKEILSNNLSLKPQYKLNFYKIDNSNINKYLVLRNMKINSQYMVNSKKIDNLTHYNWWFGNDFESRSIYKFQIDNSRLIFIWHKIISINFNNYLIGGWISSGKNISIKYKIIALNWQLNLTKKYKLPWIAIIKKKNISTYQLNTLVGFKKINANTECYKDAIDYFRIKPNQYNLLRYEKNEI